MMCEQCKVLQEQLREAHTALLSVRYLAELLQQPQEVVEGDDLEDVVHAQMDGIINSVERGLLYGGYYQLEKAV
jgi:hypothetical protein